MESIIVTPAGGARLRVVGDTMRVLATAQQTGGAYEVFEMEGPEGSGPPPHAHPWSEAYVVLEGEAEVLLDGRTIAAKPGCFFHIPPGIKHSYRITTPRARFVVVTSPGGASNFFEEVDAVTELEKVAAVAVKHGFSV
ncbi:MAG TPA: quercetin 2,3-dioxygenase [Thermoanaerobaculia bacterium]|jgi:quercetin dioxygenase-like cupin family protein